MGDGVLGDNETRMDQGMRDKMVFRLQEWKDDGFNTSGIEETIQKERDIRKVKRAFKEFKENVRALKDIELDLLLLDTDDHEDRAEEIKGALRDVTMIEETREKMEKLKSLVQAKGKSVKTPVKKKDEKELLLDKLKEWKKLGYEMDKFERAIRLEKDIGKIKTIIHGLEKKVQVLEKVQTLLDGLKDEGFEGDIRRIERKIHRMEKLNEIWKEVYVLRDKIKERKKEVVKAEASSRPVRVKVKKRPVKEPVDKKPAKPSEADVEILQFRRIDLYVQLLQTILLSNKRLLTLDTLRMAQRGLKKAHPKIMFFLIQKDFKIKSMMPDHPDSYKALEAYLNRLHSNMINLIGEVEAKERMRKPAKEYITAHIQEILASGLDDYFPVFLIIDEEDIPDEKPQAEEEKKDKMDAVREKVKLWKEQGYKIGRLGQVLDEGGGEDLALALFRKVEEEIFWLKELEKDVEALEKKGLVKECAEIRAKLKYPERISEIEDDILSLQMIQDVGGGVEDDDLI
jgi:hypothetical protein